MLQLNNLCKQFDGLTILNNISLAVEDGNILSIVGPSGGGKTTLLRCISGLEKIDSGEIIIDGIVIDPTKHTGRESPVGVVFQEYNLFPHLSVLDNIILAPKLVLKQDIKTAEENAYRLLQRLKLSEQAKKMPYQLSGGQKQRVAIARALAMKPKVLCYDEPTSALDPDLINNVAEIILSLKSENIIQIVVTHDHSFANKIADNILEVEPIKHKGNKDE